MASSKFFCVISLVLGSVAAVAQQTDNAKSVQMTDTTRKIFENINSYSKEKILSDSLQKQTQKQLATSTKKLRSARSAASEVARKQNVAGKKLRREIDSVQSKHVEAYNQKVNLLRRHMSKQMDSLNRLAVKEARTTKSLDSLKKRIKVLKNVRNLKGVKKGEQRLGEWQSEIRLNSKGLEGNVNRMLSTVDKPTGAKMGLTDTSIPKVNIPVANLPNSNLPNFNLPKAQLANFDTTFPTANGNLPSTNVNSVLPVVGGANVPGVDVQGINTQTNLSNDIARAEKEIGQSTDATNEIGAGKNAVKNLSPDNIETTMEKDLRNARGAKQVTDQVKQVEQYSKQAAKWEDDPSYRKEMVITQMKQQTVNHFAGQEKSLTAAIQQQSDVKRKYKNYEGALDVFKKPGNPMKGKPLTERLRPAVTLQFQVKHETLFDFNPQLGYRISGRISVGVGWVERWGYDFSSWKFYSKDRIFGPRWNAQIKIKEGIYALVAPEVVNSYVQPYYSSSFDVGNRKWVWSWLGGIKKEFKYSKKILGNVQMLYNLLDDHNASPYISKLNIRLGFEFPLKKKVN